MDKYSRETLLSPPAIDQIVSVLYFHEDGFGIELHAYIYIYIYIHIYIGIHIFIITELWRCPHGVMVKVIDCGIVVSEFVPQSCYYVHFQANTLGKGMNPLILPTMG